MQRLNKGKMIPSVPTGVGFLLQPSYIPDFESLGYLSFFPINFLLSSDWFNFFYVLQKPETLS